MAPTATLVFALFLLFAISDSLVTAIAKQVCQDQVFDGNKFNAQELNKKFQRLHKTDFCQDCQTACVDTQFAVCHSSRWVLTPCGDSGTSCFAVPTNMNDSVNVQCRASHEVDTAFRQAGYQGGPFGMTFDPGPNDDPDKLTLQIPPNEIRIPQNGDGADDGTSDPLLDSVSLSPTPSTSSGSNNREDGGRSKDKPTNSLQPRSRLALDDCDDNNPPSPRPLPTLAGKILRANRRIVILPCDGFPSSLSSSLITWATPSHTQTSI